MQEKCKTQLLEDAPAQVDAFASDGDIGPHFRVAKAIAELVVETDGGKVVGLEGSWGAGKSTVVGIARSILERSAPSKSITTITFDAWAHEGDPLRRTYLETLIRSLRNRDWVEKARWEEKLDEIAHRVKTTRTNTVPSTTVLGGAFAVGLLLVPLGSAFMTAALREGLTLSLSMPVSWKFVVGLLALAPLFVILLHAMRLLSQKGGYRRFRDPKRYAFLEGRSFTRTDTETRETPNPTSLEFETYFEALMEEALQSHPDRRIVLVLDNLDRVDAADALQVWSTLQTFLQHHHRRAQPWFRRLWVWVPFDPVGLRRLWERDASTTQTVSHSFLDKSFQVRFSVPPLVVSDWREHLGTLLSVALPAHGSDDQHEIYTVFGQFRPRVDQPPTPRELKLFVNQIGAIHRQWGDAFPIAHVAYFVIACSDRHAFIKNLREGHEPQEAATRLLGSSLRKTLAGLAFNVSATRGQEVLLADPIYGALSTGEFDSLRALAGAHKAGFWLILQQVAHSRFHGSHGSVIAQIATTLRRFDLISEANSRPEARKVRTALIAAAAGTAVEKWGAFDDALAAGIAALIVLSEDAQFSRDLLHRMGQALRLARMKPKDETFEPTEWVRPLMSLFAEVEAAGYIGALPEKFFLPVNAEAWKRFCGDLTRVQSDRKYWDRVLPDLPKEEIVGDLLKTALTSTLSPADIDTICVLTCSWGEDIWLPVFEAMRDRLTVSSGTTSEEVQQLLESLDQLYRSGRPDAGKMLRQIAEQGHLLHHFWEASRERNFQIQALSLYLHMRECPDGSKPTDDWPGRSNQGFRCLIEALESPEEELIEAVMGLMSARAEVIWIFASSIARNELCSVFSQCINRSLRDDPSLRLFNASVIARYWKYVSEAFTPAIQEDLQRFISDDNVASRIREALVLDQVPMDGETAELCMLLIKQGSSDPAFNEWCVRQLTGLGKEEWMHDLCGNHARCHLAVRLLDEPLLVPLEVEFYDALVDHAKYLALHQADRFDQLTEMWRRLVGCLSEPMRSALPEKLLRVAVGLHGEVTEDFFVLYGKLLRDWRAIEPVEDLIPRMFASWLANGKPVTGVEWMASVFETVPELWERDKGKLSVREFEIRLSHRLKNPWGSDADRHVSSIASRIQPTLVQGDAAIDSGT